MIKIKTKIISIILIFALMAFLPLTASRCSKTSTVFGNSSATADTLQKPSDDSDKILCALVAAKYKNNYCTEALKAITIILNTNYKSKPESFDLNNKADCLYEKDADSSVKELYNQINSAVNSVKEKTLCIENKAFYIPFSEISNGQTNTSDDYPYIQAIASPWDCFSENSNKNAKCIGASLCGIDYLCKNGFTYKQALAWYLPNFEICS